jgi:hypothetical protein
VAESSERGAGAPGGRALTPVRRGPSGREHAGHGRNRRLPGNSQEGRHGCGILMLTVSRSRRADKVEALDAGRGRLHYQALLHPGARWRGCAPRSGASRRNARSRQALPIAVGEIELDPARPHRAQGRSSVLRLTPKEFDLYCTHLMSHVPGVPVAHGKLLASGVGRGIRRKQVEYLRTYAWGSNCAGSWRTTPLLREYSADGASLWLSLSRAVRAAHASARSQPPAAP